MTKIVAITASTAGEAHTQMAAEALRRTATALGHDLKAEAQTGAVATGLSDDDIQQAEVVIVGADQFLNRDRFVGKPVYAVSTSEAIRNTEMFITEGAIPFAANDPLRIIPACIAGSAVAGGLSMLFNCTLRAPHGGIFVLAIPNAVQNVGLYIVAIAVGTLVTALAAIQLKHLFPKNRVPSEA